MSKATTRVFLHCHRAAAEETAYNIVSELGLRIVKEQSDGFTAKEKWGHMSNTNPATVSLVFTEENEGTEVTINVSNLGFGPIQNRHVRNMADQIQEALMALFPASSAAEVASQSFELPDHTVAPEAEEAVFYHHPAAAFLTPEERQQKYLRKARYAGYWVSALILLFFMYAEPFIFVFIGVLGSLAWALDFLGIARASSWSFLGKLRAKSEEHYWITGAVFLIMALLSIFFLKMQNPLRHDEKTEARPASSSTIQLASVFAPVNASGFVATPARESVPSEGRVTLAKALSGDSESAPVTDAQRRFIAIIDRYAQQYKEASNDMRRSVARSERRDALGHYVRSPGAENWSAQVKSISVDTDNIALELQLVGTDITITNYMDAFFMSMTPENTTIRPDMPLYKQVSTLKKGDYVRTNFRFEEGLPMTEDGLYQTRMTEHNSMVKPVFLVEFWEVQAYRPGSPALKAQSGASDASSSHGGDSTLPSDQQRFNDIIEKFSRQDSTEGSDIRRQQLRKSRKQELSPFGDAGVIRGWVGKVNEIGLSNDGEIMLSIQLNGTRSKVMNYMDAVFFNMAVEDVLIKPDTALFEAAADFNEGDLVAVDFRFLGDTIYGEEDGIAQLQISHGESMREPEFLVSFVGIRKYTGRKLSAESSVSSSSTRDDSFYSALKEELQPAPGSARSGLRGDAKIMGDYLAEKLPNFEVPESEYIASTICDDDDWYAKGDFDGNGHDDFVFVAKERSGDSYSIIALNTSGSRRSHKVLVSNLRSQIPFIVSKKEPGDIDIAANSYSPSETYITIIDHPHPFVLAGEWSTDNVWYYWWEDGAWLSDADAFEAYKEAHPSRLAEVDVSTKLNVREGPSTSADILFELKNGSLVIVIENPEEAAPWMKILSYNRIGWVDSGYLKKPEELAF